MPPPLTLQEQQAMMQRMQASVAPNAGQPQKKKYFMDLELLRDENDPDKKDPDQLIIEAHYKELVKEYNQREAAKR